MCAEGLAGRITNWKVLREETNWKVLREETLGWQQMIAFGICEKKRRQGAHRTTGGWRISGPTLESFGEKFAEKATSTMEGGERAKYQHYAAQVISCCDEMFPRRSAHRRRQQEVYWWCDAVKERREECNKFRRRLTRINRGSNESGRAETVAEYKAIKRACNKAILDAKKSSWRKMLQDLDEDECCQGYRLVMKKTNMGTKIRMNEEQHMEVARNLFTTMKDRARRKVTQTEETEPFTVEEMRRATDRLKTGKAPGLDGILPAIAKVAVRKAEEWFRAVSNEALDTGTFPEEMKVARLVLVPKPEKDGSTVKTKYRSISLLESFAKILEAMIEERLKNEIMAADGLCERQYGFRTGRSAIGAVMEVVGIAQRATNTAAQHKKFCVLAIDVRNAFNTVRWSDILDALERRNINRSILALVRSYLSGRTLMVGEGGRMDLSCEYRRAPS